MRKLEIEMTARKVRLMAVVGLAVLVVIRILQNGGSLHTKFLFATVTMAGAEGGEEVLCL
jgi:hypothetical protein